VQQGGLRPAADLAVAVGGAAGLLPRCGERRCKGEKIRSGLVVMAGLLVF